MTDSSSFHPDSVERLISEGYPRTFESEAFDAPAPPPPSPRAATPERPPSHAARTAVSLGRWLGKQGTITARAGLHCPVTVVDARYDYGRVLLLVRTPGETARDWVLSTSIKWAFKTTTEKQ